MSKNKKVIDFKKRQEEGKPVTKPILNFFVKVNFRDGASQEFEKVSLIEVNNAARLLVLCLPDKTKVIPIDLIHNYEFMPCYKEG